MGFFTRPDFGYLSSKSAIFRYVQLMFVVILCSMEGVFNICYTDGAFVPCTSIFKYPQVSVYVSLLFMIGHIFNKVDHKMEFLYNCLNAVLFAIGGFAGFRIDYSDFSEPHGNEGYTCCFVAMVAACVWALDAWVLSAKVDFTEEI